MDLEMATRLDKEMIRKEARSGGKPLGVMLPMMFTEWLRIVDALDKVADVSDLAVLLRRRLDNSAAGWDDPRNYLWNPAYAKARLAKRSSGPGLCSRPTSG